MITSEMCCDAVSHVHLESPILKFADLLGETWFVSHRYKITSAAKDFAAWLHLCKTSKTVPTVQVKGEKVQQMEQTANQLIPLLLRLTVSINVEKVKW